MKMHRALIALALLALAVPAAAQVVGGVAFRVQVDHDGTFVAPTGAAYRLFLCPGTVQSCTTQVATQTAAQRVNGAVTFDVAGQTAGTYTLQASARNATGGEAFTGVLVFTATVPPPPLPKPPTGLRILAVTTAADGTTTLRLLDLEELRDAIAATIPPPVVRLLPQGEAP